MTNGELMKENERLMMEVDKLQKDLSDANCTIEILANKNTDALLGMHTVGRTFNTLSSEICLAKKFAEGKRNKTLLKRIEKNLLSGYHDAVKEMDKLLQPKYQLHRGGIVPVSRFSFKVFPAGKTTLETDNGGFCESFMARDMCSLDSCKECDVVEIYTHPMSYNIDYDTFFNDLVTEIIPFIERIAQREVIFITTNYISKEDFSEELYYLDERDASRDKTRIPVDSILKSERKALKKYHFKSINNWINYEFKEAFIYMNSAGKKAYQEIKGILNSAYSDKILKEGEPDTNA